MKITLEIPDMTHGVYFCYVYTDETWETRMGCRGISQEELQKGDTIIVGARKESEGEE